MQQLTRLLLQFYVTIFGHFRGKRQKKRKLVQKALGEEKYEYLKPQPDIQQLTRLLLQFYVTIFGHFKGKSPKKNYFTWLCKGKIQVFQAPTGYSTADKAFIAVLCDNIWTF